MAVPVALADVVRVAIGEVEDFARISLLALDDVTVGGNVAVDLAHLLSELMENATHFSPPDTTVEIVGHRSDEGYTLSVSDQGIGMSADQLSEANSQLARPPLVGLALSRSLGFIVIGRLAARFGVVVKLTSSPSGGVTALVTLPADLVTVDGQPMVAAAGRRADLAGAAGRRGRRVADEPSTRRPAPLRRARSRRGRRRRGDRRRDRGRWSAGRELELDDFEAEVRDRPEIRLGRRRRRSRRTTATTACSTSWSRSRRPTSTPSPRATSSSAACSRWSATSWPPGRSRALPVSSRPSPSATVCPTPTASPAPSATPAVLDEPPAAPVEVRPRPPPTTAPLVTASADQRSTPRPSAADAHRRPGLVQAHAQEEVGRCHRRRDAHHGRPDRPRRSQRSPEEVRKMLSRYRSGLNKGRGGADGSKYRHDRFVTR